ncbi:hypothetical protein SUGI_0704480 [Cryptomeria japonica]|uniref:uncharacterized protein LOC131028367 n=1 Tax=Cryptomeria japonica TaxID=3369 RepID=UPI002414C24C|nr:uncharacterized protein LOC131028367 [Cryptomeria japonica]GLJ35013.1 hypothetical protein SUGI_0704480 [Cryptomeria japonica]
MEDLTEFIELYISECPELEDIPSLAQANHFERININSCDKLHNITLPKTLNKLTVQYCRGLQRIVGMFKLKELRELSIRECPELKELSIFDCLGLKYLEMIHIDSCEKLQNRTLPTRLLKLGLQHCKYFPRITGMDDLTELCISEGEEIDVFPTLARLSCLIKIKINSCQNLDNITLPTTLNEFSVH